MTALVGVVLQSFDAPPREIRGKLSTGGVEVKIKGGAKTYHARCVGVYGRGAAVTIVRVDPNVGASSWIVDE